MKKIKNFFIVLLLIDISLVLAHIFWGDIFYILNLDNERTIPSYYSGLKLVFISCFSFLIFLILKNNTKNKIDYYLYLIISLFFISLSFDEISELHENLGEYLLVKNNNFNIFQQDSFMWLIYLSPIILGVFSLLIYFLIRQKNKKSFIFILLGIISFILVISFEFLGGMIIYSNKGFYNIMIILEEASEKIGASLFFIAFLINIKNEFGKYYKKII